MAKSGTNAFFANLGPAVFRLLVENPLTFLRFLSFVSNRLEETYFWTLTFLDILKCARTIEKAGLIAAVYYVKMQGRNPFPCGASLLS